MHALCLNFSSVDICECFICTSLNLKKNSWKAWPHISIQGSFLFTRGSEYRTKSRLKEKPFIKSDIWGTRLGSMCTFLLRLFTATRGHRTTLDCEGGSLSEEMYLSKSP